MKTRTTRNATPRLLVVAASCAAAATMAHAENKLTGPPFAVDHAMRYATRAKFAGETSGTRWNAKRGGMTLDGSQREGTYVSPVEKPPFRFTELVPSWNVDLDEKSQGYRVEIRVLNESGKDWSP